MEIHVKKLCNVNSNNICFLSKDICSTLKISKTKMYKLHVGKLSAVCSIRSVENQEKCMCLIEAIYNQLFFYDNLTLNIWKKGNQIFLGPVVGLFISKRAFNLMRKRKRLVSIIDHLEKAGPLENCITYCFCVDNIDWKSKKVKGITFIQDLKQWKECWFSMPDIIYDMTEDLSANEKSEVHLILEQFRKKHNVIFINSFNSLDKWILYKIFNNNDQISCYFPDTILFTNFDDIIDKLKKYNYIFLKPLPRSHKKELLEIEKVGDRYKINFFKCNLKITFYHDLEDLKKFIEKFIEVNKLNGETNFIIQQGIKLFSNSNHHLNLRISLSKNETGNWETINLWAKNELVSYEIINNELKKVIGNEFNPPTVDLEEISIKLANLIERRFGTLGEMEIKLVIDEEGKVWFLDFVTKPEEYSTSKVDTNSDAPRKALLIYKYAKYLAENKI